MSLWFFTFPLQQVSPSVCLSASQLVSQSRPTQTFQHEPILFTWFCFCCYYSCCYWFFINIVWGSFLLVCAPFCCWVCCIFPLLLCVFLYIFVKVLLYVKNECYYFMRLWLLLHSGGHYEQSVTESNLLQPAYSLDHLDLNSY